MQEPLSSQSSTPPRQGQLAGCLILLVVSLSFLCAATLGIIAVVTTHPEISGQDPALDALRAALYAGALGIPFGLVAVFLRQPQFRLWRGVALMLALAGLHNGLLGGLLALDRWLGVPGLPYWLPPLVSIVFSTGLWRIGRSQSEGIPSSGALLIGIVCGLVVTTGWLMTGSPGTLVEVWLGILDAAALALIGTALINAAFWFEPDFPARRPVRAGILSAAVFAAMLTGYLATRGYLIQGLMLAVAFFPAGLVAGGLLALEGQPGLRKAAPVMALFFFIAACAPFIWTEGIEGDWMIETMIPLWLTGMLWQAGASLILGAILLIARRWLIRFTAYPAALTAMAVLMFGALATEVVVLGRPGIQPDVFFAVMTDQADTRFAASIPDRAERVQAVYAALTQNAEKTQADLRTFLDQQGVTYTPYYLVNGIEVVGNPLLRQQIAARGDVAYLLDSPHARPIPAESPELSIPGTDSPPPGLSWGVDQMDAEIVWQKYQVTGKGIVVGQADSGVDWTHPALRDQYLGRSGDHNYTWFDPWEHTQEPVDSGGHGTHTLGTVLGAGGIGVAPGAKWIACRNLARNMGNPPVYLNCMQFLLAPFPQNGNPFTDGDPLRGANVVNNSWGCPPQEGCDHNTLSIAVQHAADAGQMYVVSAGNMGSGCDTLDAPALAAAAISVGAIDQSLKITDFSSRGSSEKDISKPDVAAPGTGIVSSWPGGKYTALDGTSMAGPHVSGLVALIWSANPELIGNIEKTRDIIFKTAHPVLDTACGGNLEHNNVYGYGTVDALAAVEMALGK
jgi:hypothetical protein